MWLKEACLLVLGAGAVIAAAIATGPLVPASKNLPEPVDHGTTTASSFDSTVASFESGLIDGNANAWVHRSASDRLAPGLSPTLPRPTPTLTPDPTVSAIVPSAAPPPLPIAPKGEVPVATLPRPAPRVAGPSGLGTEVPVVVRRWDGLIEKYSTAYGLDPNLVAAVMMTESGGNPAATSPKGAVGLMQVVNGSLDPETSVRDGTRRLASELSRYNGDLQLSLAAYNAGAGAVDRFGGVPPYPETDFYVFIVLNRFYVYEAS